MEFYATPPIDGAFCRYVIIDAEFAHPVPDSMSDEAAALLEPLSVAVTTMRKAHVAPGSSILIAGAGPIGVICAQAARAFGAARDRRLGPRRSRARAARCASVPPRSSIPMVDDVAALDPQVDAFVDASGAAPAVVSGIKAVGPAGHVVLVGHGLRRLRAAHRPHPEHGDQRDRGVPLHRHLACRNPSGHLRAPSTSTRMVTGRYDLEHVGEALDSDTDPASLKSIVVPSDRSASP